MNIHDRVQFKQLWADNEPNHVTSPTSRYIYIAVQAPQNHWKLLYIYSTVLVCDGLTQSYNCFQVMRQPSRVALHLTYILNVDLHFTVTQPVEKLSESTETKHD